MKAGRARNTRPKPTLPLVRRAFSYESESIEESFEGSATPLTKTTKYSYNPALQGGKQIDNLTYRT
jgi:hypothetical protein